MDIMDKNKLFQEYNKENTKLLYSKKKLKNIAQHVLNKIKTLNQEQQEEYVISLLSCANRIASHKVSNEITNQAGTVLKTIMGGLKYE